MTCPACGGSERRPIAPGLWECRTEVQHTRMVPLALTPGGPERLEPVFSSSTCGHRYQEGAASSMTGANGAVPACDCGVFAVATCSECATPLCGDHLRRAGGRAVCGADQQRLGEQAAARAAHASLDRFATGWTALTGWITSVTDDPVERFLRALFWAPGTPGDAPDPDSLRSVVEGALDALLGEDRGRWAPTPTPDPHSWTLHKPVLVEWVWAHADQATVERVRFVSQPFRPLSGMTVPGGSADGVYLGDTSSSSDPDKRWYGYRTYLLRDGRYASASGKRRQVWPDQVSPLREQVEYVTLTRVVRAVELSPPVRRFDR